MTDRYDDPNFMDKVWEFEREICKQNSIDRMFLNDAKSVGLALSNQALRKENARLKAKLSKKKWWKFF